MSAPDPLGGLTVTTPWYPSLHNPVSGSFVTDWTRLGRRLTERVRIIHHEEWPGGDVDTVTRLQPHVERVLGRMAKRHELDVQGRWATVTRVPTIITSGFDVADRAEAAVASTRLFGGPLDTPVVHGHVGYLGGLAAARLADPASRVVVTEHSTGLADFLQSARGRDIYTEVLERSHRLTCVSSVVRDVILSACPDLHDKVVVVPNPVDFAPAHQRASRPQKLERWVFSGGLIERKGVVRAVRAFATFAAGRPEATFDLYGEGPLKARLQDIAREAGVEGRVRFHGNVTHDQMLAALADHDVLIAPSHFETFHLVVPEAVAAGVPVVVSRSGGPQDALAGVEDLVGRFVDVNDDSDELLGAVMDLEDGLDRLDLDRARDLLGAKYGHDAITSQLADLYGCQDRRLDTALAAPAPDTREHVIVSVSGWRRYAVAASLGVLEQAHVPVTLLSGDQTLLDAHASVPHGNPADYVRGLAREAGLDPAAVQAGPRSHTLVGLRAAAGLVRGALRRARTTGRDVRPVLGAVRAGARKVAGGVSQDARALMAGAQARRRSDRTAPRPPAAGVHLVADAASFPLVGSLLDISPDVALAVEADRHALGLTPVDAP